MLPKHLWTFQMRLFSAKPTVVLDKKVNVLIDNKELKPRHHPGRVQTTALHPPEWLVKSVNLTLEDEVKQNLVNKAQKFYQILNGRLAPLDTNEIKEKTQEFEVKLLQKANENSQNTNIDHDKIKQKATNLVKKRMKHWTNITYNKHMSLIYLLARSMPDYTVLRKIFYEIQQRDPEFQPQSMLDFGSGIGTATWAVADFWRASMKEYFCVDISSDINNLAEEIMKHYTHKVPGIFYRQFLPAAPVPTYDIVISAYSLLELPDTQTRLQTLLRLWRKTEKYLIIVEQGSNAGFRIINEARDFIFKISQSVKERNPQPVHAFAPCPHDTTCPRFVNDYTPCNFIASYFPLPQMQWKNVKFEMYSYVVLKKGERDENEQQWPRIVRPPLLRSKHVVCRMCTGAGKLEEIVFTSYKHGKPTYRCARVSRWGDLLPINLEELSSDNSTLVEPKSEASTVDEADGDLENNTSESTSGSLELCDDTKERSE